jgi:hypothetical protein
MGAAPNRPLPGISRIKVELPQGLKEQLQAERKVTVPLPGVPGKGFLSSKATMLCGSSTIWMMNDNDG